VRFQRYSDGAIVDNYRHHFVQADLRTLAVFLESAKAVVPVREAFEDNQAVVMRHDVHHNLDHALIFAEWEAWRGYRASYYVLPTAWYWPEPSTAPNLRRLVELGHEVGVHQDAVAEAYRMGYREPVDGSVLPVGSCEKAAELLRAQITHVEDIIGVPVSGTSSHGTELWRSDRVTNAFLWAAGYTAADFGLQYADAYHLHRRALYISDSRKGWSSPFRREPGRQTHILTHPALWSADSFARRAA
jgi:hypothetical protein